jgi:RNA polymerase sigma factor (TIGR02999 family)
VRESDVVAPRSKTVTVLLEAWSNGDEAAREQLIPLVYDELRRVAARHLSRERPDHTLRATALVHETYLRLVEQKRARWRSRAHFFAVAAGLMRRILVDHARSHRATKRGGELRRVPLNEGLVVAASRHVELVALDEALAELSALDPKLGRVVELRFFGGLSIEETAEVEGLSPATIKRNWNVAKAWLYSRTQGTEASE